MQTRFRKLLLFLLIFSIFTIFGGNNHSVDQTIGNFQNPATSQVSPPSLTAQAGDGKVTLTFSVNPLTPNVNIWRCNESAIGRYTLITTTPVPGNVPYVDEDVINNQQYWYKIRAIGPNQPETEWSNTVTATPQKAATPFSEYVPWIVGGGVGVVGMGAIGLSLRRRRLASKLPNTAFPKKTNQAFPKKTNEAAIGGESVQAFPKKTNQAFPKKTNEAAMGGEGVQAFPKKTNQAFPKKTNEATIGGENVQDIHKKTNQAFPKKTNEATIGGESVQDVHKKTNQAFPKKTSQPFDEGHVGETNNTE